MKKSLKFLFFLMGLVLAVSFFGCKQVSEPGSVTNPPVENPDGGGGNQEQVEDVGPFPGGSDKTRSANLNYIFNPDVLGHTTVTITRDEWNTMLDYIAQNPKNETCVHAEYQFEKGDYKWNLSDVGIRIRGNTSRVSPQIGRGPGNNDYVQAHFSIDFEEWPVEINGEEVDREQKMAGVMKGVILKRFKDDSTYSREVYGYNLFRMNGVWTSPRASYTTLTIKIIEEDGETETVDFGVYAMIEEIKKQFLKERSSDLVLPDSEGKNLGGGTFDDNKGNLWKCTWQGGVVGPDFTLSGFNTSTVGVEEVYLDDSKSKRYNYDLKTNEDDFDTVKAEFETWLQELNALDVSKPAEIKTWFDSKMDVSLFLKTYAVNVILGMWDDYWVNSNNFYFYFDTDGKAYFIPYDYDNILGTNDCGVDAATRDPLKWGIIDETRPLIQKILAVPEYVELYKQYLIEFSDSESFFDVNKSIARITGWHNLIREHIKSDNLIYGDTTPEIRDGVASWGKPLIDYTVYTPGIMNYFTIRANTIAKYLGEIDTETEISLTFDAGEGSFESGTQKKEITTKPGNAFDAEIITSPPTRDGYRFSGWMCNGKFVNPGYLAFESLEFEAVWEKQINISLDLNGGTFDGSGGIIAKSVYENDSLNKDYLYEELNYPDNMNLDYTKKLLTAFNIRKTSGDDVYWLLGFTKTKDGDDYVDIITTELEGKTIYAKWALAKDILPVVCDINDKGKEVKVIFRPEDFNFAGTAQNVEIRGRLFGENRWEPDNSYKLTKSETGDYWYIEFPLTDFSVEQNFGLKNQDDGYQDGGNVFSFVVNGTFWLKATSFKHDLPYEVMYKWSEDADDDYKFNIYRFIHFFLSERPDDIFVTLNGNGGWDDSFLSEKTVALYNPDLEDVVNNLFGFENPGYTFKGWSTSVSEFTKPSVLTDGMPLYAFWEENLITVTLNGNGGTAEGATVKQVEVNPRWPIMDSSGFEKAGCILKGWSKSQDVEDFPTTYEGEPENLTLYAIWIPVDSIDKTMPVIRESNGDYTFILNPVLYDAFFGYSDDGNFDIYVRGDFNSWLFDESNSWVEDSDYKMTYHPETQDYRLTLPASITTIEHEGSSRAFKFCIGSNSWLGADRYRQSEVTLDPSYISDLDGNSNFKIPDSL